ncbi:MAG: trypsin-like peptidase domain-containing protein [Deltaproteobacteria bacterium]|nr:trypsin-like peptidase domain-containing protein [Deltaproteobacteria bacterium]
MATNYHVVSDIDGDLVAVFRDGTRRRVLGLLAVDEAHDLALVKIEGNNYPALPLASSESVRVGEPIVLLGSSAGLDQSLGLGVISALRPEGFPDEWKRQYERAGKKITRGSIVQHTASSAPGSSGSPVVDMEGRVVAVHHSQLTTGPIYFGAHVDELRALLARTDLAAPVHPIGPNIRRNLLISGAVVAAIALALFVEAMIRRIRGKGREKKRSETLQ